MLNEQVALVIVGGLVRDRLIKTQRGNTIICDRAGLFALADAAYGQPKAEYEQLFGFDEH